MSEKRKDNRGRILRTGESQRKDGTYMYRYTDLDGKRKYIYKKDLNELRNCAKEIQKSIDDGLNYAGGETTFLKLYDMYISSRHNIRPTTLYAYKTVRNTLTDYPVSNKEIKAITVNDINIFIEELSQRVRPTTLKYYITTYKSAFTFAVEMDMIKKNPFKARIMFNSFDENYDKQRLPLTAQQKDNLLAMLYSRKNKYFYYFTKFILLTGLRLGEVLGITWNDVDFKTRKLKVSRQIAFVNTEISVSDTKSKTGHREIYLYNELFEFLQELKNVKFSDVDVVIDGYHNFIFAHKGKIKDKTVVGGCFKTIRQQYEKKYGEYVYITPHVLRHTFCTDMIKSGANIKTVQYLMGHSDVSMTLNIYTHVNFDDVSVDLKKVMDN